MKVKIVNNKGVEVAVKPESIIIDGKLLSEWLDDVRRVSGEIRKIKEENEKLANQLREFWEEIK